MPVATNPIPPPLFFPQSGDTSPLSLPGRFCYNFTDTVLNVVLKEWNMDIIRIQDKIISRQKINDSITKILQLRALGYSQQEVADQMSVDRTFISRLEGIGELRKGKTMACIGFPIKNKTEIQAILEKEGVDFIMLMTEEERQTYVEQRSGKEMLNELMDLIGKMHSFETIIAIGSDNRIKLIQGLLDSEVICVEIGTSPITEDKWVDPDEIRKILAVTKSAR